MTPSKVHNIDDGSTNHTPKCVLGCD